MRERFFSGLKVVLKVGLVVLLIIFAVVHVVKYSHLKKQNKKNELIISQYEKNYLNNGDGLTYQTLEEKLEKAVERSNEYLAELDLLDGEKERLQRELDEANAKNESLEKELKLIQGKAEQQGVQDVNDVTYLSVKFPYDGNYYMDANDEVQYYTDPTCTKKITEKLRFISNVQDPDHAENGLTIYCLRTEDGKIVYATKTARLVTEDEYQKSHNN